MAHEADRDNRTTLPLFTVAPWPPATMESWVPVFDSMKSLNCTCSATMTTIGEELSSFVGRRLHEDLELPQHLAACKRPDDAWRTYFAFCQKAVGDYQKEFAQLVRIGSGFADESAASLRKCAESASQSPATKH